MSFVFALIFAPCTLPEYTVNMCIHKLTKLPSLETNYETDDCTYEDLNKGISCDSSDLSIIHYNIRGLTSKIGDLNYILNNSFNSKHPDVVLLCETWLSCGSPKPTIDGYNIERSDRLHKKGGGVAVLISTKCKYRRRKDLNNPIATRLNLASLS